MEGPKNSQPRHQTTQIEVEGRQTNRRNKQTKVQNKRRRVPPSYHPYRIPRGGKRGSQTQD